ncbi:MAG: hypothetical protein K2Y27_23255 [Xanthobacteraceae bacterium]|nr:hypothetical protein [Xanthobacteraceae bacterium]
MSNKPPSIARTFRDLSDEEIADAERASVLARHGFSGDLGWDGLLKSWRALIMSEAGVGKTYECRARQQILWGSGEPAFYLDLATLAREELRAMLTPEEEERFDNWLKAQSDVATLFLDSYDELALSQGSFGQALLRLSKALKGQLGRARIVITTRPVPIDRQLIERHLPMPHSAEAAGSADEFADIAMSRDRHKLDSGEPKAWRNVSLMPLSKDQIRQMAVIEGVSDPDALMADIDRRDAEEFAQRPQDLIELCADWKQHHRIRSHREQVASNVATKLLPRADRKEKAELSPERAAEGAARLALAVTLTRRLTLRYNAESDRTENTEAALDVTKALPKWTKPAHETLLERALFGFASYGRVRFHHRSVVEYLAAERLNAFLERGVPIKAVKRLLFATTAQGREIVRPSMRPVAAWLALRHGTIFDEVKRREPIVLFDHGDPQSLTPGQRIEMLKAYVERYGSGGWRGLQIPGIQVHRFACSELAPIVNELWAAGIENIEVRDLLLDVIAAGKLTACADIAYTAASDLRVDFRERMAALDALIAIDDARLSAIVSAFEKDRSRWNDNVVRSAIPRLFPKHLSVSALCRILKHVKEPKRAIGELSWHLPRLIAESDLSVGVLEELHIGLFELVTAGAEWLADKWPHTRSRRPDLVMSLIAVCVRLFRLNKTSPQLFQSSTIALRFTKERDIDDAPAKELRTFLDAASAADREAALWADDAFLQPLNARSDAFHRLYELTHHGAIRLTVKKDASWVLARLANRTEPRERREMMLWAAMIDLPPRDMEYGAYLDSLKPLVSDMPDLMQIIENRQKPVEGSERQRQIEAENAEHMRRSEAEEAEAHESWVKFWREISDNPDAVFDPARSDNTAWDLWQAMKRTGDDSRESGWNRRFIERQFSPAVADRLRSALMQMWRKYTPTLRSERPEGEKNTYLVKWTLGLAAIAAEAEDASWATKLTREDAELAARYAPLELNGFPSWLDALVEAHPSAVNAILGSELTLLLREPVDRADASIFLQNIRHASPRVARLFEPRLVAWLDETRGGQEDNSGEVVNRLSQVIETLLKSESPDTLRHLQDIASKELANGIRGPFAKVWMPVLMQMSPDAGVDSFENGLSSITPSKRGDGVAWFSALFAHDTRGATVELRRKEFTPKLLLRLTRLGYQQVRPADDAHHEGSYSLDERDHAERARDAILSALLATTGNDGWAAKIELANDPLMQHFKDRAIAIAEERAAEEADAAVMSEADVAELERYGEAAPLTRDTMFALLRDRLEDVDDLLVREDSPRALWATISDENVMRKELARALRETANGQYAVDQESTTADDKETDIRLLSSASVQKGTIELKIGDKDRSAAVLRDTIKGQLVAKYMAAEECRAGCLVITLASETRTWNHPNTGETLDFPALIKYLNEEADKVTAEFGGTIRIAVKGINLRPRLPTEKRAKKKAS